MDTIYNMKPPRLSANQIEGITQSLLKEFVPHVLESPQATPISILIEKYLDMNLDFKCLSKNIDILGKTVFSSGIIEVYDDQRKNKYGLLVDLGTILIEKELVAHSNMGRCHFTMGHEVGHWILHKDASEIMHRKHDHPRQLTTDFDWFEWQADTFSSSILMPRSTFVLAYRDLLMRVGRTVGEDKREYFSFLAGELADIFQVSYQAAAIRMKKIFTV